PTVHHRLGEAAPPDLIDVADCPVRTALGQRDQTVALLFLSAYCGSGLWIQCLALCQDRPRERIAWRIVSWLTTSSVSPSSKATSARSESVQVDRCLPKWRGLAWAIDIRRSPLASSKIRSGCFGPDFCGCRLSRPRSWKACRALRTLCTAQPSREAISRGRRPSADRRRICARRSVKLCSERSASSMARFSCGESSRTNIGDFIEPNYAGGG